MLNDVACDRVIFLVATVITFLPQRTVIVSHEGSHWGAGGRKNSHRGPGGRELTEVTSMGLLFKEGTDEGNIAGR